MYLNNNFASPFQEVSSVLPFNMECKTEPFTKEQLSFLESAFQIDRHMDKECRMKLALHTGLTDEQIGNWFCQKRFKSVETKKFLSKEKVMVLEKAFQINPFLKRKRKVELAQQTRLCERQVENWFYNKRRSCKKTAIDRIYLFLMGNTDSIPHFSPIRTFDGDDFADLMDIIKKDVPNED